jgi:hypothetical protein
MNVTVKGPGTSGSLDAAEPWVEVDLNWTASADRGPCPCPCPWPTDVVCAEDLFAAKIVHAKQTKPMIAARYAGVERSRRLIGVGATPRRRVASGSGASYALSFHLAASYGALGRITVY